MIDGQTLIMLVSCLVSLFYWNENRKTNAMMQDLAEFIFHQQMELTELRKDKYGNKTPFEEVHTKKV